MKYRSPCGNFTAKNSELVVQIQSKVIHPFGFGDLVIANKNGSPIFLKQVATVEDTQAELQSSAFYNGRTAVSIDILKSSDANVIQVVDKTYQTLEKLKAQMPAGLNYKSWQTAPKVFALQLKTLFVPFLKGQA